MSLVKSTNYAPDIYRSLNGIVLVYKPPRFTFKDLIDEVRNRLSDQLNQLKPRPLATHLVVDSEENKIATVPNLADHPLVVGPRYNPWELQVGSPFPRLTYRSSGLTILLLGGANRYYLRRMNRANLVSIYHIEGRFGYITHNFFYDGRIQDKTTIKHIKSGRLDSVLSRIQSNQQERLFDSSSLARHSQEAYELAKAWPSRPPKMADWPVIYRLRCIHLKLPYFKIELTVTNENDLFLSQLVHDIGLMLKSGAYTESIRRVRCGPFDMKDSLTDRDWDLQSFLNNIKIHDERRHELNEILRSYRKAMSIEVEHEPEFIEEMRRQ